MKFFIEPASLTGMSDVMDVQAIGRRGDNIFVVEAETKDEAAEKLLDLVAKRVGEGQIRLAIDDEAEEFAKWQWEDFACCEDAVRIRQKFAKRLGNEQTS